MGHLHQRMHAGVGTARAIDPHRAGGKPRQGQLKFVLNGVTRQLALPAFVSTAAVADSERNPQGRFGLLLPGVRAVCWAWMTYGGLRQGVKEGLRLDLEGPLGFCQHFFGQRSRAIGIAE